MKSFFKETPAQKMVRNLSSVHDSNDDILRIIKLYNQGTSRGMNEETKSTIKYPYFLKCRASNLYIFITAAFSIFTSVYTNYSSIPIANHIIDYQIKDQTRSDQLFSDEVTSYILSSFHLFGFLGGLSLYGWLGYQVNRRKILLIVGTLISLLSSGALMVSIEYWMLFPARFLQGLSNALIWLMCFALIADIWPVSKLGLMFGFICGLYPLGMTFGLTIGVIFNYVDHKCSFLCILILCGVNFIMQLFIIERSAIPNDWLISRNQDETNIEIHDFNGMQREMDVMEEGGLWSKSSSLSTINLRDQPIVFKNESEFDYSYNNSNSKGFKESVFYRLITSLNLFALIYQIVILSAITGALETALYENLIRSYGIIIDVEQGIVISTFLVPGVIFSFAGGWFCDRFGSKIVSLTSVIILIPTFIWIGVPNQKIESTVAALVLGGITMAGAYVTIVSVTSKVLQRLIHNISGKESSKSRQPTSTSIIFAIIGSICGIGYFIGLALSKLNLIIGFFWLCFTFAALLTTCIPLIVYYSKTHKNKSRIGLSISKKSIINNMRPESFAESILSDDTTLGSLSASSVCNNVTVERKSSIIVIP